MFENRMCKYYQDSEPISREDYFVRAENLEHTAGTLVFNPIGIGPDNVEEFIIGDPAKEGSNPVIDRNLLQRRLIENGLPKFFEISSIENHIISPSVMWAIIEKLLKKYFSKEFPDYFLYSLKEIVINLYCDFLQKSDCGIDACIFDCFLNTSDNRCKKFLDLFKNFHFGKLFDDNSKKGNIYEKFLRAARGNQMYIILKEVRDFVKTEEGRQFSEFFGTISTWKELFEAFKNASLSILYNEDAAITEKKQSKNFIPSSSYEKLALLKRLPEEIGISRE